MAKKTKIKYQNVMLVDDNEIDNFINQKMLEGSGFAEQVFIYSSGKSALEYLKNLEHNKNLLKDELLPRYIFLDINMPMMDGFQFLEEFEKLDKKVVEFCDIVILTTSINPFDREKSEKHDLIKKFINKPLTEQGLEEL